MSKVKIPCDNGPYREGKGTLYEGGMRVCAFANWPAHIKPGSTVDELIHVVDMYPTLAKLAGASTAKCKPLDGMDVWQTISEGKPSPRTEIVYNVEPFRGAVRQGDWKLIWRTLLPSSVDLYNLAQDPSEKNNLAAASPEKVAAFQQRLDALAKESVKPLFLVDQFGLSASQAAILIPLVGIGGFVGVVGGGRVGDLLIEHGVLTGRIHIGAWSYLVAALALVPVFVTSSLACSIKLFSFFANVTLSFRPMTRKPYVRFRCRSETPSNDFVPGVIKRRRMVRPPS